MLPQIKKVSFVSSNPWDFSDDLIDVIARYPSIDRLVHLPVQAGSDSVLKRMNRWYTQSEYLALINRIQARIPEVKFTTDIIVGFPGETAEEFEETKKVARLVKFESVYCLVFTSTWDSRHEGYGRRCSDFSRKNVAIENSTSLF